jgi:hypothetical protein
MVSSMIPRDCIPVAHVPPRPPIELRPVYPLEPKSLLPSYSIAELMKQETLWRLVVQSAGAGE